MKNLILNSTLLILIFGCSEKISAQQNISTINGEALELQKRNIIKFNPLSLVITGADFLEIQMPSN